MFTETDKIRRPMHDTFTLGLKKSKTNLGEKIRLFFKT